LPRPPIPNRPLPIGVILAKYGKLKTHWLLKPIIPAGGITMLIGLAKVGKTTFLLDLLGCRARGVPFLGQRIRRGRTIYVSEQSPHVYRIQATGARVHRLNKWIDVYFRAQMLGGTWWDMAKAVDARQQETGADTIIFDTWAGLAGFQGEGENHTGEAMSRLDALQGLVAQGCTVILSVHEGKPVKGGRSLVNQGRGASALAGGVDQILRLHNPGRTADHPVRILQAMGRYPETPERPLALSRYTCADPELASIFSLKGTDILASKKAPYLWAYTADAEKKVASGFQTLEELMEERKKSRSSVRFWIETHQPERIGKGTKADPYRYRATTPD